MNFPLTNSQKGMWYTEKLHPGTSIGNIAATLKIKEEVDYELLEKAINLLILKNEALRLHFLEKDGQPFQYIYEYEYSKIDFFDFSKVDLKELYTWDQEETRKPFTLMHSCLVYFAILKISENESGIYCKIHHLISDGWTIVYIGNKIMEYYNLLKEGNVLEQEKEPSYLEYIQSEQQYLHSPKFIKDKEYWEDIFRNAPEVTTLKSKAEKIKNTNSVRRTFKVPGKLAKKIFQYCQENKASVFALYISALCIYINRITYKEDIVLGVPVLNRSNSREKKMVGMFISTVPLRIDIEYDTDYKSFTQKLTGEWISILRHQKYPYEEILKYLRKNNKNIEKLYEIAVSYQNAKFTKSNTNQSQEGRWHFCGHQTESLYIHINEREDDGNIIIDYDYLTDLFYGKEIEFIHDHVLRILWHALDNPLNKISELEMISEREKQKILYNFNNTSLDYPVDKTVHQLFEEQVERTPDKTALIFERESLTYSELNKKANQLARVLRQNGVTTDTVVGIMVSRSLEMIFSILAVLKAGGTYLPLDPEYPPQRIEDMIEDSKAAIILTQEKFIQKISFKGKFIDVFVYNCSGVEASNLSYSNNSRDLAYVIYTSGSTGKPKGVMVEHRALVNLFAGITAEIDFSTNKRILSVTTISFDIFVLESLLPLSKGLTIVIANESEQKIPQELNKIILENKVNMFQTTPSRFQLLLHSDTEITGLSSLNDIMIGGEALSSSLLSNLKKISKANVYNMYGPTETTVWSTIADLTYENRPHIGKPIANTKIFILDRHLNLLPIGVPGDLYIGGHGLSKGYFGKDELTDERFICNPFAVGEKMYKTGDLARWYPEGDIEYLGRTDFQVKIRGYRIELGEIEDKLLSHPDIKEAIVVVKEFSDSKKALCAYLTAAKEIISSEIKAYLNNYLPEYMIPSYIRQLEFLPKTPNDKIDRNALPALEEINMVHVQPRNSQEKKVAKVWGSVLNIKNIGIDDNFFDLGGDSLSIVQLQVRLMKKGININIQDLYKFQTIREMVEHLSAENIRQESETGIYPAYESNLNYDLLQNTDIVMKNVLLTGATGFLGVHLLEQLLRNTDCFIYCLVRGKDKAECKGRLIEQINFYFNNKNDFGFTNRIIIVCGDISKDNLGLNSYEYEELLKNIDQVIHSAAIVKHYGRFEDYLEVNIKGTEKIINFCLQGKIKLNQISSISVSGNYLTKNRSKEKVDFSERDFYVGQDYRENVYVRSKFEAEDLIYRNIENGLKADIFRIGVLTGRYRDGHFQVNIGENGFYERIKAIINLGVIPESWLDEQVEFTPVDYCCEAILKLIHLPGSGSRVFHLFNPKTISLARIVEIFNNLGISIKVVSNDVFQNKIKKILKANNKDMVSALHDMLQGRLFDNEATVNLKSEITKRFLDLANFYWPEIDREYFLLIIEYMYGTNYLNKIKSTGNEVC